MGQDAASERHHCRNTNVAGKPLKKLAVTRRTLITILITTTLLSCDNLKRLETKELVETNPTEHIFNVPVDKLRQTILDAFNEHKEINSPFYESSIFYLNVDMGNGVHKLTVSFNAETTGNALFGKDHFEKPNTENDIYIHSFGQTWYSPIYFAGGEALEFRSPFILTLEKIDDNRTVLKVRPEDPKVLKGVAGLTAHGFYSKEIEVEPTTVEEYSLILFIAEQLGDTTLKPLTIKTKD